MSDRFLKESESGKREDLQTDEKDTIVGAINEIDNGLSNIQTDNITVSIYKISNFATP